MVKVVQSYKVARKKIREKEVEPNGHGEASRDHELHLHELAPVVLRLSSPHPSTRLGHIGLIACG